MFEVIYPESLPGPTASPFELEELRAIAQMDPRETRPLQRDRLSKCEVSFAFTFAHASVFRAWWKTDLVYGACWFYAGWLVPNPVSPFVGRFVQPPRWEYMAAIGWKVSGVLEVRGVGVLPTTCIHEKFRSLSSYSLISGDAGQFTVVTTPYGYGVHLVGLNTTAQTYLRKTVTPRRVSSITFKSLVVSSASDDSIPVVLNNGATQVIAIIARRASSGDATRRALVATPSESNFVSTAALTLGTWYEFTFTFSAVAGATNCTIKRLSDNVVIDSTNFSLAHPPITYDSIEFNADVSSSPSPSTISDLDVC
jgi:hypothetical protein